jgi:hypothetical protein
MTNIIPDKNLAIFLQKFSISAPNATSFVSNYASVGIVTTNAPDERQWQFTWDGTFSSSVRSFELIYDFSQVDSYGYSIYFKGKLNGFLNLDGQLYAATNYLTYIPQTQEDIDQKILRFLFRPPCQKKYNGIERSLYYVTNLKDDDITCACKSIDGKITGHPDNDVMIVQFDGDGSEKETIIYPKSWGGNNTEWIYQAGFPNDNTCFIDVSPTAPTDIYIRVRGVLDRGDVMDFKTLQVKNNSTKNVYFWTQFHSRYCTVSPSSTVYSKYWVPVKNCWV